MKYPLRLAIPVVASRTWLGGFNYQLNLARSLASHASGKIKPVVFLDENSDDATAFTFSPGVEVVLGSSFSRQGQTPRLMQALLFGLDKSAAKTFAMHKIDIVFESARFFGRYLQQPTIAWFPDLQHRCMPEMFSRSAWLRRELGFRLQLRHGRTILLSSKNAQKDCENYYPQSRGKTKVVSFPAVIEETDLFFDPRSVLSRYQIPNQFIYLPNQFWRHKNHALLVEALGIIKKRGLDVRVVATGNLNDPRDPRLFERLIGRLNELGATQMLQVLGIIPRPQVLALLQTCTALMNPSVFEGWSTVVEEAKLFGVPMILSDIAIHREQAGTTARYFDARDPGALADLLVLFSQSTIERPRRLPNNSVNAVRIFAEAFTKILIQTYQRR